MGSHTPHEKTPQICPKIHLTPHVYPSFPHIFALHSPSSSSFAHFPPLSRLFSLSPLQLPTAPPSHPQNAKNEQRTPHATSRTATKKARAATTATLASNIFRPFQPPSSTNFNLSPFNLHPKLNTSLNRIKPKFNPLQPFAHFVFSALILQSAPNSFIYRCFTVFRFNSPLYISFSCP